MIKKTNSFRSICKKRFFSLTDGFILDAGKEYTIELYHDGSFYSIYDGSIELIKINSYGLYNYFHTKEQMREINLNKILKDV